LTIHAGWPPSGSRTMIKIPDMGHEPLAALHARREGSMQFRGF
jgi:hypothetical protein